MAKLSYKIAFPIILSTAFAITIFIALDSEQKNGAFYFVLFLIAVALFFFGYATGERFASPVQELLRRANRLNDGDLSNRIYLDTRDEIEELAKVFNKLAEKLEESCEREKNTESSVDIKVRAKTQALEETIGALEQKVRNRTIELERLSKNSETLQGQMKEKEKQVEDLKQELDELKPRKNA
jgi:methyl-accepting chemotaxis protein